MKIDAHILLKPQLLIVMLAARQHLFVMFRELVKLLHMCVPDQVCLIYGCIFVHFGVSLRV